jgi:ABC-type microcin C transport system permease subunit YejB
MLSYLIRRVLLALFTCWAISVLAFVIIHQSLRLWQRYLG